MKKLITAAMVVVLIASLATSVVSAQFTSVTSFQVQNLSATQTANVQLVFYDTSGNAVTAATLSDTIAANSNKLYTQGNNTNLPSGFNGSVVVSSDQPVAAIGVQDSVSGSMHYQGTYGGFSADAASDSFYLPTIMKAFYGYTTEVSVQNAGSSNVDVTVTYAPGGYTDTKTGLKPGQVVRFNNASTTGMPNSYIGAATITTSSGGTVVAVVNQINAAAYQEQTYEGFSSASSGTTLYTPVLMKGFYGFNTSVQVQNVGTAQTTVTIIYSNGLTRTQTLSGGQGYLFTQGNETGLPTSNWIGSARITSTASNIVAVVNQQNTTTGKAASYNAFATAATHYVGPNVMKAFYGFNTSVQVQNVGATAAACTVTFAPGGTSQTSPSALPQYGTYLFTQGNNSALGTSYIGAVDITCAGQPFVAIVNQDGAAGAGDNAMAYGAIPAP